MRFLPIFRAPLVCFPLIVLMALAARPVAAAQVAPAQPECPSCGDQMPPEIWLSAPTGDVGTEFPLIRIDWCDDQSLNAASRWIKVNGVTHTSSFDYVTGGPIDCLNRKRSSSTTVSLNLGANSVEAHICDNANNCSTETFVINRRFGPLPAIDVTVNNYEVVDPSRCAVDCFAAGYAQSTVPFFTVNAPRSITLAYNGDRVDPKPFLRVNVTHGGDASNLPIAYRLRAQKANQNFITFLNGETTLRFTTATAQLRIGGQFDAAVNLMNQTGVYDVTLIVGAEYAGGVEETSFATKVVVVNDNASSVGRGWSIAGMQRLLIQADGSALVTSGNGSSTYFLKSGSTFVTPVGEFSKLVSGIPGGGTGWTRLYPDSTKVVFTGPGTMYYVTDRFGTFSQFTYDASNRLWKIQDPTHTAQVPRLTILNYGSTGLSTITDPFNRTTNVTVQSDSTLTVMTDIDGVPTRFSYDGSRRLRSITNRMGQADTLFYSSSSGRLVSVKSPPVPILGQPALVPLITTLATWQSAGVPYVATTGTPYAAPRADTVFGRVVGPAGDTTRFTVNKWGQPLVTTDPLGRSTTVAYSAAGLPTRVTYPTGAHDSLAYDGNGLVTYSAPHGTTATSIRYTAWALADSMWGTDQVASRMFVSGGKVDSVRIAGVFVTKYQYDSRGRLTTSTDPSGHLLAKTTYGGTNDSRSRDSLPGGLITNYGYDTYGRQTTVSQTGAPTRSVTYDALNRVTERYDGVNATATRYAYDSLYLRSVTDPKNQAYSFSYDAVGRLTLQTDPLSHSDRYGYDLAGSLRRWWNRRGDSTDYVFDRVGRLVKKFGPKTSTDSILYAANDRTVTTFLQPLGGSRTETSHLDSVGRVDSVVTVIGAATYRRFYRYTPAGRIDSVWGSGPGGALRTRDYGYTAARGTLDSLRFGTGLTQFHFLNDGLLDSTTFPNGQGTLRELSERHEIKAIVDFNVGVFKYDTLGRMIQRVRCSSGAGGGSLYGYDGLGRVIADTMVHQGNACGYDEINGHFAPQTGYTWIVDSVRTFTYDAAGNRTDHSAAYLPGSNRLSGFAACSYATDLDGNVTARFCGADSLRLYWSSENRLDSMWVSQLEWWVGNQIRVTYTTRYAYDESGRLILRRGGGAPFFGDAPGHLLWSGADLFARLDTTAALMLEFSYTGVDYLHAMGDGTTTLYAHAGPDGSIYGVSDDTGTPSDYGYGPYSTWGESQGGSFGPAWKGALYTREGRGLYYMRNRWYEPRTGRFLSEDPIGLAGGTNPYVFAGNDPVNGRDPMGLCHNGTSHPDPDNPNGMWPVCVYGQAQPGDNPSLAMELFRRMMFECAGYGESCYGRAISNWEYDHGRPEEEPLRRREREGPPPPRLVNPKCESFRVWAAPMVWGPWQEVAWNLGSVTYEVSGSAVGKTTITGQVRFYGYTGWVERRFAESIRFRTARVYGAVSVRFTGFPVGSKVRGSVCY